MPSFRRVLHMGLAVRDRQASAEWYERVLGFQFVKEFEVGIPRILLLHADSGFLVGLYNHPKRPLTYSARYALASITSPSKSATKTNLTHGHGISTRSGSNTHPVRELGHSSFISLQDPDGIQIEIWLTITPHVATAWG